MVSVIIIGKYTLPIMNTKYQRMVKFLATSTHARNENNKGWVCRDYDNVGGSCHSKLFFLQCGALYDREWIP